MHVSLDVESVLVDTNGYFLQQYNAENGTDYTVADIDSWEWVVEKAGLDMFISTIERGWTDSPLELQPLEENLAESVAQLADTCTVDIVTASPADAEHIQTWLTHHGITDYEDFVSVHHDESKADLGYDIYIDDKPHLVDDLADDQVQYLRQWGWNTSKWQHPRAVPVQSVKEAVEDICAESPAQ